MGQIALEGDWTPEEVAKITTLAKSLGVGDGEAVPSELVPATVTGDFSSMLSDRQKKLTELWRKAGKKALEKSGLEDLGEPCDEPQTWEAYTDNLQKSPFPGALKVDKDGDRFTFDGKSKRWKKVTGKLPELPQMQFGKFQFPVSSGMFGDGVYFPVLSEPTGYLRLRMRVECNPEQFITDEDFYELETDLASNLDLILESRGIRAIAHTVGDRVTQIMIRSSQYITPMGVIAGSGSVPQGVPQFRIVKFTQEADSLILDAEMGEAGDLAKAAKSSRTTLSSTTHLNGTKLATTSAPTLDRVLVRDAIARCVSDGVDLSTIQVHLISGIPDFLPKMTHAFCLPSDGVINLCPHDPNSAIASMCSQLATRLQLAVRAGAMSGDVALELLNRAAQIDPNWWLESLIKRYAGAIHCYRIADVMSGEVSPYLQYLQLLSGRGLEFWGERRAIAECMAEDYRCAFDPSGYPNLITLEFDAAVPAIARMSQQVLLKCLGL